jgi:hypothetical protein
MFDNEFTLTRIGGGASWQGFVEVVGFTDYHNTIVVPNDENWIVQGMVDPISGLPTILDARLSSGSAFSGSHASIILRQLRISHQVAPVDEAGKNTLFGLRLHTLGGAFRYEGGSGDPFNLVKIAFVGVIFDHNSASSCALPLARAYHCNMNCRTNYISPCHAMR